MDDITEKKGSSSNHRPSFDSRRHFAKYLVDLREKIEQGMGAGIWDWITSIRFYSSNIGGFVDPDKHDEWKERFNQYVTSIYSLYLKKKKIPWTIYKLYLMELQDQLFELSSHLFLPTEEAELEDFDPKKILGID